MGDAAAIPRDQRPRVAVRVQDRPTDVDHDRGRRDRTENQVQRRQRGLPGPRCPAGLRPSPACRLRRIPDSNHPSAVGWRWGLAGHGRASALIGPPVELPDSDDERPKIGPQPSSSKAGAPRKKPRPARAGFRLDCLHVAARGERNGDILSLPNALVRRVPDQNPLVGSDRPQNQGLTSPEPLR